MKYDLEANWDLLNTCNYRCAYCFVPSHMLGEKLRVAASPAEWQSAFDATGFTCLVHLTGGEPSLYPGFAELCERLTRRHYISLNSNLTHRALVEFADRVSPARVSFINAGFHLEERERRSGYPVFLRHAGLLATKGFKVLVSLVATPRALERFGEAIEILKPIGLVPIPKLLRGMHAGRRYPAAYTEADQRRFRAYADLARKSYQPTIAAMTERPSADMLYDDMLLDGEPTFRGKMCDAGHLYVHIETNGDVFRCAPNHALGNILAGTFKRRSGPSPCDASYCYYFCQKYSHHGVGAVLQRTLPSSTDRPTVQ